MKTITELRELTKQYGEGKTLAELGLKTKDEARDALRKAVIEYIELLEVVGVGLGCDPVADLYDSNMTFPVCNFEHGETWELSAVPLEMAEARRPAEKSKLIAAWKKGAIDTLEGWNRMLDSQDHSLKSWGREELLTTLADAAESALRLAEDHRNRTLTSDFVAADGKKYEVVVRPKLQALRLRARAACAGG